MTELGEGAGGSQQSLSPLTRAILELIRTLLPPLSAIVGGLWVAFTYLDQQKEAHLQQSQQSERENKARLFEARKPFIDRQLSLYLETSKLTGALVSLPLNDIPQANWIESFNRFEQLYWAELSMVEDDGVKNAMQDFGAKLRETRAVRVRNEHMTEDDLEELKQRSYRLARALRASIEKSWNIDLSSGAPEK